MRNIIFSTILGLSSIACSDANTQTSDECFSIDEQTITEDVLNKQQLLANSLNQDYLSVMEDIDLFEESMELEANDLKSERLSGQYRDFFRMDSITLNNRTYATNNFLENQHGFSSVGFEVVREEPNLITSPFASFRCYGSGNEVEYIKQEFSQATVIFDLIGSQKFVIYNTGFIKVFELDTKETDGNLDLLDGNLLAEFSTEN